MNDPLIEKAIETIKESLNDVRPQSVMGLVIRGVFNVEGINYVVKSFPTYYTVIGENQNPVSGEPNQIKTSIRHTQTMFWKHYKDGRIICPTNPI